MKNSLLTTIMNWVLAAGLVLSMFFAIRFFLQTKELREIQAIMARYQNTHQVLNVLLGDVVEYSKKDPGIQPILESIGLRPPKAASTAGSKPSGK